MRVGSLCSGYGGLDMGLELALGPVEHAWFVEYDKHPSAILAHHWPEVPNRGDLTTFDVAELEPVDILTAGYPCQPFSHAGKRKGSRDERHLWPYVAATVGALRPRLCLFENVAGHVSLGLDAVLWDLAALGYDTRWGVVRASDAGAPHRRERLFIVATDSERLGQSGRGDVGDVGGQASGGAHEGLQRERDRDATHDRDAAAPDARGDGRSGHEERDSRPFEPGLAAPRRDDADGRPVPPTAPADANRLGHERSGSARGWRRRPADGDLASPDPASDGWDEGRAESAGLERGPDAPQRGHAAPRADLAGLEGTEPAQGLDVPAWGAYEPAIRRWERAIGRRAPRPTEPGRSGERLSPAFVEWMMGLPAGHVTDVPDLPRNAQLKALGNGVVPQQAALACRLLGVTTQEAAA